jgi:hypothetical protein
VDANGCRTLVSPSPCAYGFCADSSTCGTCDFSCAKGSCAVEAGSCLEAFATDSYEIQSLSATADGLFWCRENLGVLSTPFSFAELPVGQTTPIQISTDTYSGALSVTAVGDYVYAYEQNSKSLMTKRVGQALETFTAPTQWFAFGSGSTAFFIDGLKSSESLFEDTIPSSCDPAGCVLGGTSFFDSFVNGPNVEPGLVTSDGSNAYFVEFQDSAQDLLSVMSQPLSSGMAASVGLGGSRDYDGNGSLLPLQLAYVDGGVLLLMNRMILRYDTTSRAITSLYAPAIGAPGPSEFVTDGGDLFLVQGGQLLRVRAGTSSTELLGTGIDTSSTGGVIPHHNLALTPAYVYVVDGSQKSILRWKR